MSPPNLTIAGVKPPLCRKMATGDSSCEAVHHETTASWLEGGKGLSPYLQQHNTEHCSTDHLCQHCAVQPLWLSPRVLNGSHCFLLSYGVFFPHYLLRKSSHKTFHFSLLWSFTVHGFFSSKIIPFWCRDVTSSFSALPVDAMHSIQQGATCLPFAGAPRGHCHSQLMLLDRAFCSHFFHPLTEFISKIIIKKKS